MNLEDLFALRGKVAVVAGGHGHLGSALTEAMRGAGMEVVVLDVAGAGSKDARCLPCDVTSKNDLGRCRDEILRRFGRVDVLLNAAGTNAPTSFMEISAAEIERIMGVNLVGPLYACQVFGETMIRQRGGSIINFSSVSSGPPLSKAFVYSAAKAAITNLTQNLAREWAPYDVRVNALRPGFFPTPWSMEHFIDDDRKARILGHTPMGRFGRPEELVGAVLWLSSAAARFVTGAVISVDGGFTAMTL
ncbi:MAG: SDR family oxidoreductase [Nitrospirae bacterium]|nr:SDR family oxidoreductase [Nitrospirota bacterium]